MKKIILTGDRPTGRLHLGHYVGSLRRRVELQESGEYDKIYVMIADAQALTDNADNPEKIRQNIIEVALDYLSVGIDPAKTTIFIQSQVPELTELAFYYMNLVTVSRVQRNPTVKTEIKMRNFETSIPVGFLSGNRQPIQPRVWRNACRAGNPVAFERSLHAVARDRRQSKNEQIARKLHLSFRHGKRSCKKGEKHVHRPVAPQHLRPRTS